MFLGLFPYFVHSRAQQIYSEYTHTKLIKITKGKFYSKEYLELAHLYITQYKDI